MNTRHSPKKSHQSRCRGVWNELAVCAAIVLLGAGTRAHASSLTINATFDSTITSQANAAAIEGAINAAIGAVESNITSPNNITVAIYFQGMSGGLGSSLTTEYSTSYYNYYNQFAAVATSPTQQTALASLGAAPGPATGNPVNGNGIVFTSAEARNLGFIGANGTQGPGGTYDSVIGLNLALTNPGSPAGGTYGLQAVSNHEIDEVLGIGGTGSTLGSGNEGIGVGDLDLFRYSAPGVRSFSTSAAVSSYFSINSGNTNLTNFNQAGGGSDYSDWRGTGTPQVQDAFGTPGANPTLGANELTAFSAIGYELTQQSSAVPEPAAVAQLSAGAVALVLFGFLSQRWKRRSGWGRTAAGS